jgi:hypothetical protein
VELMPFRVSMLTDPLPWVFLAGVFLGAAASRATRRTANRPDPHRATTVKWVFFCVWLSLAVLCVVAALLVPGSGRALARGIDGAWNEAAGSGKLLERGADGSLRFGQPLVPWVALAGFALALFASRFRKAVGIPVAALAIVVVVVLGLFLQSVRAFTGETEIATVKALAVDGGKMRLEVQPAGRPSAVVDLDGDQFATEVQVVVFDDLWVFLGAKSLYRFVGLQSFAMRDGRAVQMPTMWDLDRPTGITRTLWTWFEENDDRIPGVKTAQTELTLKRPRALGTWAVTIQNDGGVEIVSRSD